mmetsp:Transcript_10122/g.21655  ORF Transcript_10122/g.21655 Transcript_10122/m.21655 type:complete len:648 (+) Transcript_10122:87-2030(+)
MAQPGEGQPQDPNLLSSLEELLRRTDYVLEVKSWDTIVKYITAGGKPDHLVECLADSYVGYAQMAGLVCQWLKVADGSDAAGATTSAQQPGMEAGADAPSTSRSSKQQLDEFHFLKEFTKSRFDPDKLSGVFMQYGGKPPPWLEGMTSDPRGRQLIYELSAVHKNCLLLNFAIQKILLQGHEDEVASVGSSLAGYFTVFHRLLAARLRAVLGHKDRPTGAAGSAAAGSSGAAASGGSSSSSGSDVDLHGIARELTDSCAQSQHTYLHAQQLLVWLGRHPRGSVFRRLSQELEITAASSHSAVWSMMRMFVPPGSPPSAMEACTLTAKILAAKAPALPALDVIQLAALYTSDDPPPLYPIQHPQLLHLLLSAVFTPGKAMAEDMRAACIELLARATTGLDGLGEDEQQHVDSYTAEVASGTAERLEATQTALCEVLRLGRDAWERARQMAAEDAVSIYKIAEIPVAAMALLHYMRCQLGLRAYYDEAASQSASPIYIRFAMLVAKKQPGLMKWVIELVESALLALGSQRADLSKLCLDAAITLMRDCGGAAEVMAMVDRWSKEADPSMVRYLILQVLAVLGPPYSPAFAAWLLQHMAASGIRRGREVQRRSGVLLQEFANVCASIKFVPPLKPKELALLQELRVARAQ